MTWRRRRDFHAPPLWHFHRVIAGRREEDRGTSDATGGPHVIEVKAVDWLCRENGKRHHTERYELVQERRGCVARRGFDLRLVLACRPDGRHFDPNRDRARFVFEFGRSPNVTKGTRGVSELRQPTGGGVPPSGKPWETTYIRKEGEERGTTSYSLA